MARNGVKTGGGSRKGRPNKVTIQTRAALQAYLHRYDLDPFQVLADLMRTTDDERVKVSCATALADRLLPRLKAIELSGDPDKPVHLQWSPAQRQSRIAALLAKQRNGEG